MGGPAAAAAAGDKAKIDEEYMSLMAELGEGPPPEKKTTQNQTRPTNTMSASYPNIFDNNRSQPRALMAAPAHPPPNMIPPGPPPPLMPPPPGMAPPGMAPPPGMAHPPWSQPDMNNMNGMNQVNNMSNMAPQWGQPPVSMPPPPGVMQPPPPPPGASNQPPPAIPSLMSWMPPGSNQPPPPGDLPT